MPRSWWWTTRFVRNMYSRQKNCGIKIDYKNCASRWSLTHCNMMHGTHNVTLTHCSMMHGTHSVTLTHCNMMHGTHSVALTHCNMMHGTHNVTLQRRGQRNVHKKSSGFDTALALKFPLMLFRFLLRHSSTICSHSDGTSAGLRAPHFTGCTGRYDSASNG